jgi:hypothetical protein
MLRRSVLFSLILGDLLLGGLAWADEPAPPDPGAPSAAAAPPAASNAPAPGAPPDPAIAALTREVGELKRALEAQTALPGESASASASADESVATEPPLRIYGWTDMGLNKTWVTAHDHVNRILPSDAATFVVGNINLYFDFQPTEKWSSLVELRFTNLPDGADVVGPTGPALTRTTTNDYGAPISYSFVQLGGLILERAYIQYRHDDALQIRVGQFLTPFGIWNVDHGTPTLIALALPVFMVESLFPAAQIGVEVVGSRQAADWELGYMAYLSNGRTPGGVDPTDDKMFGGRVYASRRRPWGLQVGLSGLTGRYSDRQARLTSLMPVVYTQVEATAYREIDLGADVSLDIGRLRLRSEFSRGQYVYEPGKRSPDYFSVNGGQLSDSVQLDWYALAAYRLPWFNLEPYVYFEYFRWPTGLGQGFMAPSAGLNVYFTAAAQLRIQYLQNMFYKDLGNLTRAPELDKKILMARLVLGF